MKVQSAENATADFRLLESHYIGQVAASYAASGAAECGEGACLNDTPLAISKKRISFDLIPAPPSMYEASSSRRSAIA